MSKKTISNIFDNREEFNAFYSELKSLLEKHLIKIMTNPHNDDSFFEINGKYSHYPILMTIVDDLNIEESCGDKWGRFVTKTPNGKPTNLFPPSLHPLSDLAHSN